MYECGQQYSTLRGLGRLKSTRFSKTDIIDQNKSIRIKQQFATKRIKIGPSEPEDTSFQRCVTSLRWANDVT